MAWRADEDEGSLKELLIGKMDVWAMRALSLREASFACDCIDTDETTAAV